MIEFDICDIEGAFDEVEGLPQADWEVIDEWMQEHFEVHQYKGVWEEVAAQWLEVLANYLDEEYQFFQTDSFFLLTSMEEYAADKLIGYSNTCLPQIEEALGDLAGTFDRRLVLIAFHDVDHYYRYLSYFYDGEDFGSTIACFVDEGYPHIATLAENLNRVQPAVLHELVKAYVKHLDLPRWAKEGLAQKTGFEILSTEHEPYTAAFGSAAVKRDDVQLLEVQRLFADDPDLIQAFWSGRGFDDSENQAPCHWLGNLLFALVCERYDLDLVDEWLKVVSSDDAGFGAARTVLSLDLGDLVGDWLGEGDWAYYLTPNGESDAGTADPDPAPNGAEQDS